MAQPRFFTRETVQDPVIERFYGALRSVPMSTHDIAEAANLLQRLSENSRDLAQYIAEPNTRLPTTNITFSGIVHLVETIKDIVEALAPYGLEAKLFHGRDIYNANARAWRLGLNEQARGDHQYVVDAANLLECLFEAKYYNLNSIKQGAPVKELDVEEEAPPTPKPEEEKPPSAGIPIPAGGERKKEEKEKKEEEEKKKEKEKPEEPAPPSEFKDLATADRLFRREVLRIQSAITHQLAAAYGISPAQFQQFEADLTKHIVPIVLVKLNSLEGDDFKTALQHSSNERLKLYQQAFSSLQRNIVFQAALRSALQNAYRKQTGRPIPEDQLNTLIQSNADKQQQETIQKMAEGAQNTYAATLSQANQSPLSDDEINQVSSSHGQSATDLEGTLRATLDRIAREGGARITTSQLNDLFVRLQGYGLTKKYASALTDDDLEQFYRAFRQTFGGESNRIIQALRTATGFSDKENYLLSSLLLSYADKVTRQVYADSSSDPSKRNLAALYAREQHLPESQQSKLDQQVELNIQQHGGAQAGVRAMGLAMYAPMSEISARHEKDPENQIFTQAERFKKKINEHRQLFPSLKQRTFTYLFSSIFGWDDKDIQSDLHLGHLSQETDFYILSSYYLYDLPDNELYASLSDPLFNPGVLTDEERKRQEEENGVRALQLLSLFLGPEFFEAFDKIYKVANLARNVPVLGDILDKTVFLQMREMGKAFDLLLKAILVLISLDILAIILNIINVANTLTASSAFFKKLDLAGSFQRGLKDSSVGIQSFFSSLAKKTADGIQDFVHTMSGAEGAAHEVLGAPIAATHVIYGAAGVVGGAIIMQSIILSAFITPRQYAGVVGGPLTLPGLTGFEGCWPTTGHITGYHNYADGSGGHAIFSANSLVSGSLAETAVDIGAPIGTPVYAPFSGTATFYPDGFGYFSNRYNGYPLGNYVLLNTGSYSLLFGHLSSFAGEINAIQNDVSVQAGQIIGYVGTTGHSTGPHLHYSAFPSSVAGFTDIISLLPLTPQQKLEILAKESVFFSQYGAVSATACAGGGGNAAPTP